MPHHTLWGQRWITSLQSKSTSTASMHDLFFSNSSHTRSTYLCWDFHRRTCWMYFVFLSSIISNLRCNIHLDFLNFIYVFLFCFLPVWKTWIVSVGVVVTWHMRLSLFVESNILWVCLSWRIQVCNLVQMMLGRVFLTLMCILYLSSCCFLMTDLMHVLVVVKPSLPVHLSIHLLFQWLLCNYKMP